MKLSDRPELIESMACPELRVRVGAAIGSLVGATPAGLFDASRPLFWVLLDGKRPGSEIRVLDGEILEE